MSRYLGCVLALAVASPAGAQPADSAAAAEQLFNEARTLFDGGDFAAACPKFDASYNLDPALGTLLNLATCYEKNNQLASAWGRYRELVLLAGKTNDAQRLAIATERATALEPRLPKLTIRMPATPIPGLVIKRDDATVDPGVIGTAIYVDPGPHTIVASAPGRKAFTTSVSLAEAEAKEVDVPALAIEVIAKPPPPPPVTREIDPGRNRRVLGLALGGGGIAVVATGLGFGIGARSAWNGAFEDGLCDRETLRCTPEGQIRTDTARDRALVADIVTGIGVATVAAGAILYFTAPRPTTITVHPTAEGGVVTLGGSW
jgi:hypothetical protein